MSPPKKAAKKSAAKHASHDVIGKDMRRAFEHLGRVEVLHQLLDQDAAKSVIALNTLARHEVEAGNMEEAAELLRAAEHLSFGALHVSNAEENVNATLLVVLKREFNHKRDKAKEHWAEEDQHHPIVEKIYLVTVTQAEKAFAVQCYRRALELVRAAEALAQVSLSGQSQLGESTRQHKLSA